MLTYQNPSLNVAIPVPVSATPAVVAGAGLVAASDDGYVRFYDSGLAKTFWQRRLDRSIYASLAVDAKRKTVIVASTGGLVACFDLRGNLVWSAEAGVPIFATPALLPEAGVLVIAAFHSRSLGLDLRTGARLFDRTLPRPWHATHPGAASYRDPYASPAVTAAGTAIVCCAEHVICLGPDGTELWRTEVGHGIKASPAILDDTGEIAVCCVDGRCLFLDSSTGQLRGEVFLGAKVTASPALSAGVLAIGTADGTVAGLDIRTHEIVWTAPHGAPRAYTSFSVLPNGDFIATSARGNIVCLGHADGRFRWETSQVLGLPDHDPAMDISPIAAADGRMYCASYSGVLYEFRFQPVSEENYAC